MIVTTAETAGIVGAYEAIKILTNNGAMAATHVRPGQYGNAALVLAETAYRRLAEAAQPLSRPALDQCRVHSKKKEKRNLNIHAPVADNVRELSAAERLLNWTKRVKSKGYSGGGFVARLYAGILGLLAFLTTLVRGMLHGGDPESVLWSAWCSLLAFVLVGGVVGWFAGWIVEDTVRSRFAAAFSPAEGGRAAIGPSARGRRMTPKGAEMRKGFRGWGVDGNVTFAASSA